MSAQVHAIAVGGAIHAAPHEAISEQATNKAAVVSASSALSPTDDPTASTAAVLAETVETKGVASAAVAASAATREPPAAAVDAAAFNFEVISVRPAHAHPIFCIGTGLTPSYIRIGMGPTRWRICAGTRGERALCTMPAGFRAEPEAC